MNDLRTDIRLFCETHGLAESTFGRLALNDARFVADLDGKYGRPRRVWPETEASVRRFMATYRPEKPAQDAA